MLRSQTQPSNHVPQRRRIGHDISFRLAPARFRRGTVMLVLPLAAVVSGCRDGGSEAITQPSVTSLPRSASATVGAAPHRTGAIEDLVAIATAAWSAKDAALYASICSEDAETVNPVGGILVGREAIRAVHVFLFTGPFAGSTQTMTIRRIQYLTGTLAVVHHDVSQTGYAFLPPNIHETEPGVIRSRMVWVVAKREGSWEIVTQQITPIPPPV